MNAAGRLLAGLRRRDAVVAASRRVPSAPSEERASGVLALGAAEEAAMEAAEAGVPCLKTTNL